MMYNGLRIIFIFCCVLFACLPPPQYRVTDDSPRIRVGLLENINELIFTSNAPLRITDETGKNLQNLPAGDWQARISNSQPASQIFIIHLLTTKDQMKALNRAEASTTSGQPAIIKTFGRKLNFNSYSIVDNRLYKVYLEKIFASAAEARRFQKNVPALRSAQIVEDYYGEPKGTIQLEDAQKSQHFEFSNTIRLHGNIITLRDVKIGEGFHWETRETRQYTGVIEFEIDNRGKITVINELPIEKYLCGVVPAEMPASFPEEALKAQAIAVRGIVLNKMGVAHPNQNFDVCDDVHCQVYAGLLKENDRTNQAVRATQGMILTCSGKICNTVYSAVCGGHTESAAKVWNGPGESYLVGVLDADLKKYESLGDFLQQEQNIHRWLLGKPTTYCNIQDNIPSEFLVNGSRKYFRWQINHSSTDLTQIIQKKTGKKFGRLSNIEPLTRGVSGRLTAIRVVGTQRSFEIQGELNIRQALSPSTLNSSCFTISKTQAGDFQIIGAGFGHGVGMCQYGAAGMALSGRNFSDILTHYYAGAKLARIY